MAGPGPCYPLRVVYKTRFMVKAPQLIKLPVSAAFIRRADAVRAFRHAMWEAYRRTHDDVYVTGLWDLPWYLNT